MDIDEKKFFEILECINFTDDEKFPSVVKDKKNFIFQSIDLILKTIGVHENFETKILYKNSCFTFNIFELNEGSTIIDHDHPGRQGMSFVLNGYCCVRTLTLLENKRHESYLSLDSQCNYKSGDTFGYGCHQGNIHGIESEQGACLFNISLNSGKNFERYYYLPVKTTGYIVKAKRILMKSDQNR